MIKPGSNFQVPDDMRNLLDQGVTQARAGFEKVMNAASEAVSSIEQKSGDAQEKAAEARRKGVNFVESSMAAAFDFAQNLVSAKSIEDVLKLQTDYIQKQFASVQEHVQEAGAELQRHAKAAAEDIAAETAKLQEKAKEALAEGAAAARKAADTAKQATGKAKK